MGLLLLLLLLLLVLHSNIASFNKSWVTFFLFNVILKILAYFTVEKKKKSGCGLKSERKTKKGEQFELSWVGVWGDWVLAKSLSYNNGCNLIIEGLSWSKGQCHPYSHVSLSTHIPLSFLDHLNKNKRDTLRGFSVFVFVLF